LEGLLKIYSPSFEEAAAVDYLVAQLNAMGLRSFRDAAGNAIGILDPSPAPPQPLGTGIVLPEDDSEFAPAREVVLLGHIDTHPGIVEVRRERDLLFGRGAVDAKGPLCAFAAAVARVGPRAGWRIVVVGAVEEECPTSRGAHFAKTQYRPDMAVIGEPSGWDRVTLGYKGSLWLDYILRRDNAHSAGRTASASEEAVEFWLRVKDFAERFNQGKSKLFDRLDPTLRGMQSDNDGLYETARLTIGLRLPLALTVAGLEQTMTELAGDAQLQFSTETPAFRAEKNNALVRAFLGAVRAQGGTPGFTLKTGTSDMNVVGPYWNCPIVTYGPGDSNLDHTPNEHIDLNEYDQAVAVLTDVIKEITAATSSD
jgi:LysW-gamma-L-lysine carboxypeptidase